MDSDQFWYKFCVLSTIVIICFTFVCGGCIIHRDYRKAQLIEKGIDPLQVRHSFTDV